MRRDGSSSNAGIRHRNRFESNVGRLSVIVIPKRIADGDGVTAIRYLVVVNGLAIRARTAKESLAFIGDSRKVHVTEGGIATPTNSVHQLG